MNDIRNIYSLDIPLDTRLLLYLYRNGLFPMADGRDGSEIRIFEPETRGIIPIDTFAPSTSLRKLIKKDIYQIRHNSVFLDVIEQCSKRDETWINDEIILLYGDLFEQGYAHSFEVFNQDDKLVGGLYGIAIGKAFFGESMFSYEANTSKLALCGLIEYLKENGYLLLDTQFVTPHLETLGCVGINQDEYLELLKHAINV